MILPEEFTSNLKSILKEEFDAFSEALAQDAPVSIRLNPVKPHSPSFSLKDKIAWSDYGYYIKEEINFNLDPAFHAGAYFVEDASAQIIGHIFKSCVENTKPLKVLDLRASNGNKATHLASFLKETDLLVVNETIKANARLLKENLIKSGFINTVVVNQDAETFADLEGFFDVVLIDALSSKEALFKKDSKTIKDWSQENVERIAARQKRILSAAAMLVAPHGTLLYSTNTYSRSENQENATWLCRTLDFEEINIKVPEDWGIVKGEPGLQFFPHKLRGEGFYIAAFENAGKDQRFVKGKPNITRLPRNQTELLSSWVKNPEDFQYYLKNDGKVIALRNELLDAYGSILKALNKPLVGLELGFFKGADFIPSQAFALSGIANKPVFDVNETEALGFLENGKIEIRNDLKGWILITYQNLPLGWQKIEEE